MKTLYTYNFDSTINDINNYNSGMTNAGYLIQQYTDISGKKYVQPIKPNPYYIYLQAGSTQQNYPYVITWSDDIDYVFTVYATTLASINITLTLFNKKTGLYTTKGTVRFTPTEVGGTKTIYGHSASLHRHINGTCKVSGTTVTGSGTTFQSSKIASGARIGFGTTNASLVTTWYEIASIDAEGTITLTTSAGTIAAGTSYIIEEIRLHVVHQRAGTGLNHAYGGLHIFKGLHENVFGSFTIINQATNTDNIRAVYKLDPGGSVELQYPFSVIVDDPISDTEQYCYVYNRPAASATQLEIIVYNVRAALTCTTGIDITAFQFRTGLVTIAGTMLAFCFRIYTANHGPATGVKCLYFITSTRLYACPLTDIYATSTIWLKYAHTHTPPGTVNTFIGCTNATFDYSNLLDRFVISSSVAPFQYVLDKFGDIADRYFMPYVGRIRNPSTAADAPEVYTSSGTAPNTFVNNGIMHTVVGATTNNYIYSIPLLADCMFAQANKQYVMTPKINTPGCTGFYGISVNRDEYTGSDVLGTTTDDIRTYFRTSGIDDDSGAWTLVPADCNISSISGPSNEIQIAICWNVMGIIGATPWIYGVNVGYEDGSQDSHYLPSLILSSASLRQFSFMQAQQWYSNIPRMRILLYNAITNFLILDDDTTSSAYGTWQYSTDGINWLAWDATADAVGNYIRYTANSLPASTQIRALLKVY